MLHILSLERRMVYLCQRASHSVMVIRPSWSVSPTSSKLIWTQTLVTLSLHWVSKCHETSEETSWVWWYRSRNIFNVVYFLWTMEATCKWYGIYGYCFICVGPSNWSIGLICSVYCEKCLFSPLQTIFRLCIPPERYRQASLSDEFSIYIVPAMKSLNLLWKHSLPLIKYLFSRNSYVFPIWIFIFDVN